MVATLCPAARRLATPARIALIFHRALAAGSSPVAASFILEPSFRAYTAPAVLDPDVSIPTLRIW